MPSKKKATLTNVMTISQVTQVMVEVTDLRVLEAHVDYENDRADVTLGMYTADGVLVKNKTTTVKLTEKVLGDLEDVILDAALESNKIRGTKESV